MTKNRVIAHAAQVPQDKNLQGVKVAILVTDGFEQVELTEPKNALHAAGAETLIVSPNDEQVRGWNFTDWGVKLPVDLKLDEAKPEDFDALLLPGGVINPDALRIEPKAVAFVKAFFDAGERRWHQSVTDPGRSSRRARRAGDA